MLRTVRVEKVDEKNGVICLVPMFPSCFWSLNCVKKCIFCNFVLTLARNPSLLKQFTYMHLNSCVTHFQEMVLFVMLWLTVVDILGFKVEEFC